MIEQFAELVPKDLLESSGKVFYSGRKAFEGTSDLYVIGVNPGGDPSNLSDETVGSHMYDVIHHMPENWSAYRDESWSRARPGTKGMQPRVLHMFNQIGKDPGEVPASNLVFARSRNVEELAGDFDLLAKDCWPFHRAVIDTLGIKVILCLGKETGTWVRRQLHIVTLVDEFIENNGRRWKSEVYRERNGITVIAATHPSKAKWTTVEADPTELVVRALAS